ncbi:MAG: class D beta-lactamase [Bacteroidales bacterium]
MRPDKLFNRIYKQILIILALTLTFAACQQIAGLEDRKDFKTYYEKYKVDGCFVLYEPQQEQTFLYHPELMNRAFTPASTFKICNSLIGLETKVIPDQNFVIPWDSVQRAVPAWNMDQDMKTAFRNSTVWYYQELARRVGGRRMHAWINHCGYGNADTTGGIDQFWLTGGLRITPLQQISFLQLFHDNQLPFSQRNMDIVKEMMIVRDTSGYVLRAKTGWGFQDGSQIGWYVGYLEKDSKVYYFSNLIMTNDSENPDFAKARIEIVYDVLDKLKIMPH